MNINCPLTRCILVIVCPQLLAPALCPVYTNTFSSMISFSMKTQRLTVLHLHIVFVSFSAVYKKTMKTIENGKNQQKSIACVFNVICIICDCCFVASFSKVCILSENDPSTRQRYHYNNIVFKSFHIEDCF